MGMLDWLLASGKGSNSPDTQDQPFKSGILGNLTAAYHPSLYAAQQGQREHAAIYDAIRAQYPEMKPQEAMAMAVSPQYLQQQGPAFLAQKPEIGKYTDSQGRELPLIFQNQGIGHGGVTAAPPGETPPPGTRAPAPGAQPPGTTVNPTQATSPAPVPAQGGAPASAPPSPGLETKPAWLGGGGADEIIRNIQAMKAAGRDPHEALPLNLREEIRKIENGEELLKDLPNTRGAGGAQLKSMIEQVGPYLPGWDPILQEKRAGFIESALRPKGPRDFASKRNSLEPLAQHLEELGNVAESQGQWGIAGGLAQPNHFLNRVGNAWVPGKQRGMNAAADQAVNELSTYIAQSGNSTGAERVTRAEPYGPDTTPQERGNDLLEKIKFVRGQYRGMANARDDAFATASPERQATIRANFPVGSVDAMQRLDNAEASARRMMGQEVQKNKAGKWVYRENGKLYVIGQE